MTSSEAGDAPDREPENEGAARGPLSSLLNGVRVLDAFTVEAPLLGVNDIARRVELHKSTVSRILATLEGIDLVERDATSGRFRLGIGLIGLAGPLLAHLDVRTLAHGDLETLVGLTGETCALAVWSGHASVIVEQLPSPRQVKHTTPLGARFTRASSASVQVFLAELDEAAVRTLLREGHVQPGPAGADALFDRLAQVRAQGYGLNDGETDPEELSVSAPIRDHRGEVVAAVLLSAPRARVTDLLRDDFVRRIREAAERISSRLGARTP